MATQIMYTDDQRDYYNELCRIYDEYQDKKIEELKKLNKKIEKHADEIEERIDNFYKDDEYDEDGYKYELLNNELSELEHRVVCYDYAKAEFYAKTTELTNDIIKEINWSVHDETLKKIAQKIYKLYLASKKIKSKQLMHEYKRAYDYILNNAYELAVIQRTIHDYVKQIKELITKHKINKRNDEQSMQIIEDYNDRIRYFKDSFAEVDEYAHSLTHHLDEFREIKEDITEMLKNEKKEEEKRKEEEKTTELIKSTFS